MRGNMAFKTAVEIFLIAFAVAILLMFIWRNVSPGTTKASLERQKITLCGEYVKYDANCNGILDSTEGTTDQKSMDSSVFQNYDDLTKICGELGTPEIKQCCNVFCSD